MSDNWEDQEWNCSNHVVGWDNWYYRKPESRLEKGAKITNDTESLFVYEKIKEKLDQLTQLVDEIQEYNVDTSIKLGMINIRDSIQSQYQNIKYLNTRPEGPPVVSNDVVKTFYEMSDIEREWANKKDKQLL